MRYQWRIIRLSLGTSSLYTPQTAYVKKKEKEMATGEQLINEKASLQMEVGRWREEDERRGEDPTKRLHRNGDIRERMGRGTTRFRDDIFRPAISTGANKNLIHVCS